MTMSAGLPPPPLPPQRRAVSPSSAAVRNAIWAGWLSWRTTLTIAHVAIVPWLGVYLGLVAANNLVYGYSFWNDVPPTQAADNAAVGSLWVLLALSLVIAVLAYGWLCQQALNSPAVWVGLRESLRPGIRSLWFAAPLLLVTAAAAVALVPGLLVVPLVGAIPFLALAPTRPAGGYWGLLGRQVLPLAIVGAAILPVALIIWGMVAATAALAGLSPPMAWLVGWMMCAVAAIGVGGLASGFAHVYQQDGVATEPAGQGAPLGASQPLLVGPVHGTRDAGVMANDDPGWPVSWKMVLWLLVPHLGVRRMTQGRSSETDGLVLLRQVFLSFCFALVAFGVVLAILYSDSEQLSAPSGGVAAVLLVLSAVGLVIERLVEKPLQCADDTTLAASYRTRFFLRIAFSEAAALFGFVGFFLTYAWWPYPLGVAIAAVGFIRAAPSRRNLARDEEDLIQRQCGRSLVGALRSALPPASGT